MHAYFSGDFGALDGIAVDGGGTSFEEQVWKALRTIPPGTTMTYRRLAEIVRRPRAVRAVGLANARNPVCLVIPCHRIIGSNGHPTGFMFNAPGSLHGGISCALTLYIHCCSGEPDEIVPIDHIDFEPKERVASASSGR